MKFKNWTQSLVKPGFYLRRQLYFMAGSCGQNVPADLLSSEPYMPLASVRRATVCFCLGLFLAIPAITFAQTNYYAASGTEYGVIGSLPGDQIYPDVALNAKGGYVVWQ